MAIGTAASALALLPAAGLAGDRHGPPVPPPTRAEHGARVAAVLKARTWASTEALAAARAARRREELRRLLRSTTVEAALRRALLTGRLSPAEHAGLRRDWARAGAAVVRLPGVPGAELAAVTGAVRAIAARHELTTDRIDPLFLVLRRNTAFWARGTVPAPGWRTSFGDDPAVFQYYPGRGLALQPLASWGRANALAHACLSAVRSGSRRHPCRERALRRALDGLLALAARRHGFTAWEYYFSYGRGIPPWLSGMTQATAMQALARGYRALGEPRWRRAALRALGAFEQPPPAGVAVAAPGGDHYLLYSFDPGERVFNGDLQAVTGLRDTAALLHSRRAARLFRRGERAARVALPRVDTGAWSLYSAGGREAPLGYHVLITGFLGDLCARTGRATYCRAAARFRRYEREPTRIGIAPVRRLRPRRPVLVRFSLSKLSMVRVRVWGVRGLSLSRDLSLPRGHHWLRWSPPSDGRFRLRIEARGPSGPAGVELRTLRVARPHAPHHHRRAHRRALVAQRSPVK